DVHKNGTGDQAPIKYLLQNLIRRDCGVPISIAWPSSTVLASGGMRILEWLRDRWLSIAWITIYDLDDRVECLENKLIEIGNTIMATLEALGTDTAAALTAATTFISDVNTEVADLKNQVASLTAALANVALSV